MICIKDIASYIPQGRESNFAKKEKFGLTDNFIVEKLGVERISRKGAEEETSDLCLRAIKRLKEKTGFEETGVDCLVVCTQNPDGGGIPHTSAILHGKLNISEQCAAFDISLGCSGYVYSLSVVKAFMEANGLKKGLLFTADPYSKVIDPEDKDTVVLFGDAATVTLLEETEKAEGLLTPGLFSFASRGKDWAALHNHGKHLFMNGRAIFNFAVVEVPLQINQLLKKSGLEDKDIDLFLFHQGSKYVVDQLRKRMKLPEEKVPIDLARQGNTVSSSIPLLLEKSVNEQSIKTSIASGFGVGLSWASCLLRRQG